MAISPASSAPNGPFLRVILAVPILGHVLRDLGRDVNMAFYLLVILVTMVVFAVQSFGLAALVLTALAMVPVMFTLIIAITLP